MVWWEVLGGVIAGICAIFPVIKKYLSKFARIVSKVADLFSSFILLESVQEQFLRKVAEVLEKPETLKDQIETMKNLVEVKKKEFETLKKIWQELLQEI